MENLIKLEPADPRWLDMVEGHPETSIFHHPAWMGVLAACYGYRPFILAVQDPAGQVCAGIPMAEVNDHLTPRRWVALPFSDACSPIARSPEAQTALEEGLVSLYRQGKAPRIEVRAPLLPGEQVQVVAPFMVHTVPLESDPARVAKRAHRQQLQNVRAAEKHGLRIERGSSLDEVKAFYHLHCQTRRKHGVPVQPWRFFERLTHNLLETGLGFVLLAYRDETCISAGLFLHWQKTLTYKYSATDPASLNLRPNHLVTWKAMEWGCQEGFQVFDFGRADLEDEGLRAYKVRWGAEERPLKYTYIPTAPASSEAGKLSQLFKEIIRRSPVWVCRASGQILYRYFA